MGPARRILLLFIVLSGSLLGFPAVSAGAPDETGAGGPVRRPLWKATGDKTNTFFGESVGTAGDVNGDGLDDVIVGASGYHHGQGIEGAVFVYHGSDSGLSFTAAWTVESDKWMASLGESVGTAGDVNGDGVDDVIVGALGYSNGQSGEGRAFVYHGSASGLSLTPAWSAEGDQAYAQFGGSVGTAGDVNADGFDDVIVGAPNYDNGLDDEGRAFVYHGSAAGLSLTPAWTAESDEDYAHFGLSAGTAGDVNADGFDDVIVGASHYTNGHTQEGRAFVYHGSASGLSTTPVWTAESDQEFASFGESVGTAGDVNGDGYDEVIVGAPSYIGLADFGLAFVYRGSASGLPSLPPGPPRTSSMSPTSASRWARRGT